MIRLYIRVLETDSAEREFRANFIIIRQRKPVLKRGEIYRFVIGEWCEDRAEVIARRVVELFRRRSVN